MKATEDFMCRREQTRLPDIILQEVFLFLLKIWPAVSGFLAQCGTGVLFGTETLEKYILAHQGKRFAFPNITS